MPWVTKVSQSFHSATFRALIRRTSCVASTCKLTGGNYAAACWGPSQAFGGLETTKQGSGLHNLRKKIRITQSLGSTRGGCRWGELHAYHYSNAVRVPGPSGYTMDAQFLSRMSLSRHTHRGRVRTAYAYGHSTR